MVADNTPATKSIETFFAFGVSTNCTGCTRAKDTSAASRAILKELSVYDDRSAQYGETPGKPNVIISIERVQDLRATDPNYVDLENRYNANMQAHLRDESACYRQGGAVMVYDLGQASVRCALETNEG